jgi:hypothetical protein
MLKKRGAQQLLVRWNIVSTADAERIFLPGLSTAGRPGNSPTINNPWEGYFITFKENNLNGYLLECRRENFHSFTSCMVEPRSTIEKGNLRQTLLAFREISQDAAPHNLRPWLPWPWPSISRSSSNLPLSDHLVGKKCRISHGWWGMLLHRQCDIGVFDHAIGSM